MAPRGLSRGLQRSARGACIAACLWLAGSGAVLACTVAPHTVTAMPESLSQPWGGPGGLLAWYDGTTTRYAHGVLGDAIEGSRLHAYSDAATTPCGDHVLTLPDELVFEDTAPRLSDLDGDGRPEIIVVQSHQRLGAQLAIYRTSSDGQTIDLVATTPFIGRSNRWLAPIGAGDLDGDGQIEIAYIDRPHLARTLRVWRFSGDTLTEIASLGDLSNHRIGEPFITGGIRSCGDGPEMITADRAWSRVMATRLSDGRLTTRALAPFSPGAVAAAMACGL